MDLMTLGQIARRLDQPIHRVKYAIERYRIEPTQRAGILRLWNEDGLARIERSVRRLSSARCQRTHNGGASRSPPNV